LLPNKLHYDSQQSSYSATTTTTTLLRPTPLPPPTPVAKHEKLKTNMAGAGRSADNGNVTQSKQETCLLKSDARACVVLILYKAYYGIASCGRENSGISSLRRRWHDGIIFLLSLSPLLYIYMWLYYDIRRFGMASVKRENENRFIVSPTDYILKLLSVPSRKHFISYQLAYNINLKKNNIK